jgi:hypothetical protein
MKPRNGARWSNSRASRWISYRLSGATVHPAVIARVKCLARQRRGLYSVASISNFKQPNRHCERKRSNPQGNREARVDCFVACAPLRKRLAFVAGNDAKICVRDLATRFRASYAGSVPPYELRGRRECRALDAPAAACVVVESTRVSHHGHTGNTRHSPRNGFNGFLHALPGDRACLPPSPADFAFRKLDASVGASGPHDFAVHDQRSRL